MDTEIPRMELAVALARTPLPQRQQATKTAIGFTVARVAQQREAVFKIKTGADQQADPCILGGHMRPHDAR